MDNADQRIDLRGLTLLERCRASRHDDAARVLSQRLRELDAAKAAEHEAQNSLVEHRREWMARENAMMAASIGGTVPGQRFRTRLDDLDVMADGVVRQLARLSVARDAVCNAQAASQAARAVLVVRQRRLQQSQTIGARVLTIREAAAQADEERDADDDIAMRYVGSRCRR